MTDLITVLQNSSNVKVIDDSIAYEDYIFMNLSAHNPVLTGIDFDTSPKFETFITNYLESNAAKVAFGGYNEERNLYKRSSIFNNSTAEERNIHIGLDLWIKAGTKVLAAVDGIVHSFRHNEGLGNYGPTIILQHEIDGVIFYTLYGHLSMESINTLNAGDAFEKGQQIGTLGDATVNGDYAPHLHFQIINDIESHSGDYPGVCNRSDLQFYLNNCPDPNLLLKIKS